MPESYTEKFDELRKSISNFTELNVEKPLGDKLKDKLGKTYNTFLKEEISSLSKDFRNVPLMNLVKKNSKEGYESENFTTFYENYIEKTKKEMNFDFDKFEELLDIYSTKLINLSDDINSLESEIIEYFNKIDKIKSWVYEIPDEIEIDTDEIYDQIEDLLDCEDIKNKIKLYKDMKIKYYFLKHYFFVNPFIRLAEEENINFNDSESMYKNDLESSILLNDDEPELSPPPSILSSIFSFFG